MTRTEQREATRARIVDAAVAAFAEQGFEASSTRDIAARASVTQGLVTYHFPTKDELWRAAAESIFGALRDALPTRPNAYPADGPRAGARDAIAAYVRFAAAHPELFRFMVDAGHTSSERMQWLVDTHLDPHFSRVAELAKIAFPGSGRKLAPHVYYALAGASSLIFAVGPECEALTGLDPSGQAAVQRHADLVARLFLPE